LKASQGSGVARILCALGQNIFCATISKTAEFEVKNGAKARGRSK